MEGVPDALWEAARTAGPFGTLLMLVLWWLERVDRVRLQRERDALLERVLTTMNAGSTAIHEATHVIRSKVLRD